MACNGCGEATALTKEQVENLIQSKIDEGKIQGGLLSCDGEQVPAKAKVLLCSMLADKVKELIKDGTIDVVTDVAIEDNKLVVTDGAGKQVKADLPGLKSVVIQDGKLVVTSLNGDKNETELQFAEDLAFDATTNKLSWKDGGEKKEAVLPYLKGVATDKALVVTLPDGSTVEVPKAGNVSPEDSFDDTIEKDANNADKFGVKLKGKGGLERALDGIAVKLGDGVTVDENGAIVLSEVFAEKPIKGKGTKADPLTVALNDRDFVVNAATGEISLKAVTTDAITDLNKATPVLGYSTFFGVIDKARGRYVVGVPAEINSEVESQNPTSVLSELKDGENYDFNGWQIASSVQVDQYLFGTDKAVWHRVNDGGMNSDGSLKEPNAWTVWRREINNSVSVVQIQQMQNQINDHENRISTLETANANPTGRVNALETANANLAGRVKALEDLLAGFVPLKDASGTVQLGLISP